MDHADKHKLPRVIVATTAFAPLVGGAEVAVQEYIKQLQHEFDFVVVTARLRRDMPTRDTWNGIQVIRVGWGMPLDKLWLIVILPWHIARLCRETTAQTLVWVIMASYAGAGACLANMLTGAPYALTLQEGDNLPVLEKRLRFGMALFRQIFIRAKGVQVIAPFLADWARSLGACVVPAIIPNGVAVDDFTIPENQRSEWRRAVRAELSIPVDAPVVLSVSRLVKKNGLTDLIAAAREIDTCHVVIIGQGQLEAELREQCAAFAERVHFVGTKPANEIIKYGAAADMFCRPSLSEGLGNVFLEAMCMNLPVVATDVGGIPTIITQGVNGVMVPPHALQELRRALENIWNNPRHAEGLRKAGRETALAFRWENLAPRLALWMHAAFKN